MCDYLEKWPVCFDRTTADLFIFCLFLHPPPFSLLHLGFLGATAPHALTSSATPNAVLNSLNSSMSPLQTPSPSNPAPSPSLWPSALTSTQGTLSGVVVPVLYGLSKYFYIWFIVTTPARLYPNIFRLKGNS